MQYLILGANGFVGSYLYKRMKLDELDVIGTRHRNIEQDGLLSFDVNIDLIQNITGHLTGKEKTAIICFAQTDLNKCKTEYDLSRQINVVSLKKVVMGLIQEKFHIIFFSTDAVFDGTKGNYTEKDMTNAVSQYGRMKVEAEQFLIKQYPEVCIFRMPRVVGVERDSRNMLTDLENKLQDKEIRCIKGNVMSIIAQEDIYQACLVAAKQNLHGIYHISDGEAHSRVELAEKFFSAMGVHKDIVEYDLDKFGFRDSRPLKVSLDNSKFRKEEKYEFTTYEKIIEQYLIINGYKK